MKHRSLENSDLYEKAEVFASIRGKNKEEYALERIIMNLNLTLEKLECIKDRIKTDDVKAKEIIEYVDDIKEMIKEKIVYMEETLEKIIPYQKEMELERDIDGDGLTNREEIEKGLDPFSYDTDNDGINDKDEVYTDFER